MDKEYQYHVDLFCKVIDIFAINKEFGGEKYNAADPYRTFYNILTHGKNILYDIDKYNSDKHSKMYELLSNIALIDLITSGNHEYFSCESFELSVYDMTDYAFCNYESFKVGYFLGYIKNNKAIYEFYNNKYKETKYDKFYEIVESLNNKYRNKGKEIEFSVVQWPYFPIIHMSFTDFDNISNDIRYVRKYMSKNLDLPGLNEDYIGIEGIYDIDCDWIIRNISENKHGHLLTHWK